MSYVLAQALSVDSVWLMRFDVPMKKRDADANKLTAITKEPEIVNYAYKIMQLDDTQRQIIFGMIDQMSK